jgi:hypothetical protein
VTPLRYFFLAAAAGCIASASLRADGAGLACPGIQAHVTVHDYAGPLELVFCVDPNGLKILGGDLYLTGGDPSADGLFHNGFEFVP